jgi:sterol desaturase/sphingolipid hydroxylase (fatty acid hydroxylase superfamily)
MLEPYFSIPPLMSSLLYKIWYFLPFDYILWINIFVATVLYLVSNKREILSFKALFEYCFPRKLFLTKDTRDHLVMIIVYPIALFFFLLAFPQLGNSHVSQAFNFQVQHFLGKYMPLGILGRPSQIEIYLFFILLFLVEDFWRYLGHYLAHKIPFLWHFHAGHHSTTVLTPLAFFYRHPLYIYILFGIPGAIIQGVSFGIFLYFFKCDLLVEPALIYFIVNFILQHLLTGFQHTEYPISFPPLFNRVIVTHTLHQVHHSNRPEYINKNFSIGLTIWDELFGTLYIPKDDEPLTYGLPDSEKTHWDNTFKMTFYPFVYCFNDFVQFIHTLGKWLTYSHSSQE